MFEYAKNILDIQKKRLEVQQFDAEMKYTDPEYGAYIIDNRPQISELQKAISTLEKAGKE